MRGAKAVGGARFWARAAVAVGRRPRLWVTAAGQARRLARPRWWTRPPFLPVPDRAYIRFRLETQYGADAPPEAGDVVTYLEWCRQMNSLSGRPHRLRLLRRRSAKPPPSRLERSTPR